MKTRGLILLAGAFLLAGVILGAIGSAAAVLGCSLHESGEFKSWNYNTVFQPTCHNCYEIGIAKKMGANTFKEVLDQVKNVEIDIFDNPRPIPGNAVPGEWFVRHGFPSTFNDNNCTGNGQGTNNLGACLTDIKQWSDAHPGHDPITLFLDKKEAWSSVSEGRRPADLDRLVNNILGAKLYRPASLRGAHSNPREAARKGAWPTMGQLAGKVIVALTGGPFPTAYTANKALSDYVADRGGDAALFAAPATDKASEIDGTPYAFTAQTALYVVFYNIEATDSRDELGRATVVNNFVSRLWGGDKWVPCKVLTNCINDIALNDWKAGACDKMSTGFLREITGRSRP
jgi:Phosphoinositide phospholipase C, Ca2+-dependent